MRPSLGLIIEVERHWLSGEGRSDFQSGLGAREQPKSPQSIAQRRLLRGDFPFYEHPATSQHRQNGSPSRSLVSTELLRPLERLFWLRNAHIEEMDDIREFRQSGEAIPGRNHAQRLFANIFTATATASKNPQFARFVSRPGKHPP